VSAPSTYLPYDLPLWLSQTLRHSARRAAVSRRRSIIWGCSLLALRPRPGMTPSRARVSLALRWRLPRSGDVATRERLAFLTANHVSSQQAPKPAATPPSNRDTSRIRAQTLGSTTGVPAAPTPTLLPATRPLNRERSGIRSQPIVSSLGISGTPGIPDWNRLPPRAGRRGRRSAPAVLGPQMVSLSAPYRPLSPIVRRPETREVQPRLSAWAPINAQASDASVTGPGLPPCSTYRKPGVASGPPDPVKSVDPLLPLRGSPHQQPTGGRLAPGGGAFEPSALPELMRGTARFTWHPAALAAVWPRVTRLIEREVVRRVAAAESPAFTGELARPSGQPSVAPDTTPEVTDRMVAQVVTRLRALAREERFRAGRLR
jgi:hypothetical protein